MSLDVGDLLDGLCNLLDVGPFRSRPHWPLWRRALCWVLQLLWWLTIIVVLLMLVMAIVD